MVPIGPVAGGGGRHPFVHRRVPAEGIQSNVPPTPQARWSDFKESSHATWTRSVFGVRAGTAAFAAPIRFLEPREASRALHVQPAVDPTPLIILPHPSGRTKRRFTPHSIAPHAGPGGEGSGSQFPSSSLLPSTPLQARRHSGAGKRVVGTMPIDPPKGGTPTTARILKSVLTSISLLEISHHQGRGVPKIHHSVRGRVGVPPLGGPARSRPPNPTPIYFLTPDHPFPFPIL